RQRVTAPIPAQDPALDWKEPAPALAGVEPGGAERGSAGAAGRDRAPGRSRLAGFRVPVRTAVPRVLATEPAHARRRVRRLLAAGSALAVVAAGAIGGGGRAGGGGPGRLPPRRWRVVRAGG